MNPVRGSVTIRESLCSALSPMTIVMSCEWVRHLGGKRIGIGCISRGVSLRGIDFVEVRSMRRGSGLAGFQISDIPCLVDCSAIGVLPERDSAIVINGSQSVRTRELVRTVLARRH